LATLRRDGFASMDAGESGGTLTTRPVRFQGQHLFVNVDDPSGELRVEALHESGAVIAGFTKENCVPVAADKASQAIRWKAAGDLSSLTNQAVRFRFHLKNGRLYSFWVSPGDAGSKWRLCGGGRAGVHEQPGHRAVVAVKAWPQAAKADTSDTSRHPPKSRRK
jgi:hypothetical protein